MPDTGVSRVVELENVLGEILDMYHREILVADDPLDAEDVGEVFERAMTICARSGEEDEEGY